MAEVKEGKEGMREEEKKGREEERRGEEGKGED